ncbi:MerR family transcriptional regulator [Maridesulfovibrio sp.]|uniref:MerR family transcriptional regulator n=1 Tax=Maridesulfovibrio sp. TaxID=2795000 RepID=UPI002A18C219|nr:MerR family transcriptional regulator [Maridesulfovibrio sp.]
MSGQIEEKTYKIGQAAKLVGLKSYVLRFWEGEFEQLEPIRTLSGQRLYSDEHISLIRRIKGLLHDEGLTIEGARKRLEGSENGNCAEQNRAASPAPVDQLPLLRIGNESEMIPERKILREVRAELQEIRKLLG